MTIDTAYLDQLQTARLEMIKRGECLPDGMKQVCCFMCLKPLFDPVSIQRGIGPECLRRLIEWGIVPREVWAERKEIQAA